MTAKKTSTKYYTSSAGVVAYKENPWAHELVHTMKRGGKTTGFATTAHELIDTKTGEISTAYIGKREVVDRENFVKVYGAGIVHTFELNKSAQDLFKSILTAYIDAVNEPDQIYLNYLAMKEDYGYSRSRTTYNNGLNELCTKGFLAPVKGRDNLYWVNATLFYRGDRMRIVNEYVVKGSKAHDRLLEQEAAEDQLDLLE